MEESLEQLHAPADRQDSNQNGSRRGEAHPVKNPRKPNLTSLQIPSRSLENLGPSSTRINTLSQPSPNPSRGGLPPRPNSTKGKPSLRGLLPQRSLKTKSLNTESEKANLLLPGAPSSVDQLDKPSNSRSFSLTKGFSSPAAKRTHSLPVTPIGNQNTPAPPDIHVVDLSVLAKQEFQKHMTRSYSVPGKTKSGSLNRLDSFGGRIRVIPVTPRPSVVACESIKSSASTEIAADEEGEDIPEEEAVCRICLVELAEGGETLKMECNCKGELALAHQECVVKWFSIKGNKTCDVCKEDVKNLPVTLLRIQNPQFGNRQRPTNIQLRETVRHRFWHDVPILVMVSMLAYFCFLEQLLVSNMGTRALAISLPFSCVLGLLSSMIASSMVTRRFIWAYASFQFAFVILFAHIFYDVLNITAILSVLLSSFTGFGISIGTSALLVEYLRWKIRRRLQAAQHQNNIDEHHHPTFQQTHDLRTRDTSQPPNENRNHSTTSLQQE